MNIRIYQVNMSRDVNNVGFASYENLEKWQGTSAIDSTIYDKVFEGEVECKSLEDVYVMFNRNHPTNYKARSLSKSDIVEVIEQDGSSKFHYCDSIGFKEVEFDPEKSELSERFSTMNETNKISVLLVEPEKYPKVIEIDDSLESMQAVVGGSIEEYMPFEDEIAIICNEEGKLIGLPLNRAIYAEPEKIEMSYNELKKRFREAEEKGKEHLKGYITFTSDSFTEPYSEESRTYVVSSNNKAFIPNMGGYSIYGSSLDGKDLMVRLEQYMAAERGGKDGWKIEKCCLEDNSREMIEIMAGTFFITYAPVESEKFLSLPKELADKYREKFKYPERFAKVNDEIVAIPFKPKTKEAER